MIVRTIRLAASVHARQSCASEEFPIGSRPELAPASIKCATCSITGRIVSKVAYACQLQRYLRLEG